MKLLKAGMLIGLLCLVTSIQAQTGPKVKNTRHIDRAKKSSVIVTKNYVWKNGPKIKKTKNWKTTNPEYKAVIVRKPQSFNKPRANKNATMRKGLWFI